MYLRGHIGVIILAGLSIGYSAYIALSYAHQLPLDEHSFRQTQTALTAYWFVKDGFKFAYETPVGGYPWSIPFEFPIYQFFVAIFSKLSGASLDWSGRIISYLFMLLSLIPFKAITKKLQLPDTVFYTFTAILFSTPVYIYWGRTFMIETTAMFFSVLAIKYFVDFLIDGFKIQTLTLYSIFITLSILQKATTGLPVVLVIFCVFIALQLKKSTFNKFISSLIKIIPFVFIPIAIGIAWTIFTDHIKSLNDFGSQLTSSSLSTWNWGTAGQRFSSDLYEKVLWQRIFLTNLAGTFGVGLLLFALHSESSAKRKFILIVSILLGIIPLFLFTNLHIVHDYYQSANLIFIVYAISVALCGIIVQQIGTRILIPSIVLILISNYFTFQHGYSSAAKTIFTKTNSRDYAVGEILKRDVPEGKQFIAFGNDWSSTFAYISQRKSFAVPQWFKSYDEAIFYPEKFVEKNKLGAVVSCLSDKPSVSDILSWASNNKPWKVGETNGCYIATPQKTLNTNGLKPAQCQGSLDMAQVEQRGSKLIITFAGWTTMSGGGNIIPDDVFFTLTKPGIKTMYLDTIKVPRHDVNAHLGISDNDDIGLSRIISADIPAGKYVVGIIQSKGDIVEICQLQKELIVDR